MDIMKSIDDMIKSIDFENKAVIIVIILATAYIIAQLLGIFKFHINYSF